MFSRKKVEGSKMNLFIPNSREGFTVWFRLCPRETRLWDGGGEGKGHRLLWGCVSRRVVSWSLRPHALWSIRLLCPWNSPGKNTAVGCRSLLQGNLPDPGMEPRSPALQADPLPSELPGPWEQRLRHVSELSVLDSPGAPTGCGGSEGSSDVGHVNRSRSTPLRSPELRKQRPQA